MSDLQVIFENFTDVYRSFVNLNGMDYATLKPFSSDSSLLVFYTPPKMSHSPKIKKYQLVSKDEPVEELFVRVLKDTGVAIKRDSSGNSTVFEGKTYPVKWLGGGDARFVFQRTPMLTLVYETLEQQLATALVRQVNYNRQNPT
jgi:hypothetical protein